MAQVHKVEMQAKIKSSPHKIFDVYKNKTYLIPKICPEKLQSIQVLHGDGKSVGSIRLWNYVMMGISVIAKDKIVAVDEDNYSITFELIDGEVTKYFKSFKATFEANITTHTDIKWTLEYEKASDDVPINPHSHLEFLLDMSKEIDAYLL